MGTDLRGPVSGARAPRSFTSKRRGGHAAGRARAPGVAHRMGTARRVLPLRFTRKALRHETTVGIGIDETDAIDGQVRVPELVRALYTRLFGRSAGASRQGRSAALPRIARKDSGVLPRSSQPAGGGGGGADDQLHVHTTLEQKFDMSQLTQGIASGLVGAIQTVGPAYGLPQQANPQVLQAFQVHSGTICINKAAVLHWTTL